MASRYIYTDGIKNIELPQYPDSAWTFYTEAPSDVPDEFYGLVSTVFRAVNMTAEAMASLPFAIMQGETDIETSEDYNNKLGWLPDPVDLLRRWRASWSMTNSAYGFMETVRGTGKNLRYIVANTITPEYDANRGIYAFKRKVGNQQKTYSYKQGATTNRVVPLYILDHTTELLPSKETEFKAAMNAAGILYYTDFFVKEFFKRGGVIPSLIAVKGVLNETQADKVERSISKLMRNIYKYMTKAVNADALEVVPLGQSVEVLKDTALYEQSIANVAMAFGMPLSLLLANSANFATALEEKKTWFNNKIVPDAKRMQSVLNRELFGPYGYRFEFRYEASDEGTEEEATRAQAAEAWVRTGIPLSIVVQMIGAELPEGVEPEDLDKMKEEADQKKAEREQQQFEQRAKLQQGQQRPGGLPQPPRPPTRSFAPDMEQAKELVRWREFAGRRMKKDGTAANLVFEVRTLPDEIAARVRDGLKECKTAAEIDAVFDTLATIEVKAEDVTVPPEYTVTQSDGYKALADALNRLYEEERKSTTDIVVYEGAEDNG